MARRLRLSPSTVDRIWHCAVGFKLSNDPLFVRTIDDLVGPYLNLPQTAVVLCVDEEPQVQAVAKSQPAFPMMPGMPEERTHDYVVHGDHEADRSLQHS